MLLLLVAAHNLLGPKYKKQDIYLKSVLLEISLRPRLLHACNMTIEEALLLHSLDSHMDLFPQPRLMFPPVRNVQTMMSTREMRPFKTHTRILNALPG